MENTNETVNTNTEVKEMKVAEKAARKYNVNVKNVQLRMDNVDGTTTVETLKNLRHVFIKLDKMFKTDAREENLKKFKGFAVKTADGEMITERVLVMTKKDKVWYRDLKKSDVRAEKNKVKAEARAAKKAEKEAKKAAKKDTKKTEPEVQK